jgi:hypothetical protein
VHALATYQNLWTLCDSHLGFFRVTLHPGLDSEIPSFGGQRKMLFVGDLSRQVFKYAFAERQWILRDCSFKKKMTASKKCKT